MGTGGLARSMAGLHASSSDPPSALTPPLPVDPSFSGPAQLPWRPSAVPLPLCPAGRSDSWAADPHSSLQGLPCTGADSPPGGSSDQDQASPKPNSGTESKYGLDPDLIPNVVQVLHDDEVLWGAQFFVTDTRGQLPPLSSTHCTVQDRGNASPRFLRCTSYSFPSSPQVALLSQLPLAAIVQPFARLARGEPPLPVSDPGLGGPVRCSSCGAHMNPFMDFQDCGQRFYCPFCASLSEVPWQYYTHTDRSGRRVDWLSRAELSRGSYEFLEPRSHGATQEPRCSAGRESARVLHREGGAPAFIFLIDVSVQAVQQGAVSLVCEELRTLLDKLPRDSGMDESALSVGVVTYDRTLHLYSLSPALSRPHMLVVTETEDLELPLVEGLLVPVKDCRDIVDSLLAQIPSLFADTREAVVIFEPVLQAGVQLLKDAGCPGKLLVFHTTPPAGDSKPGSRTDSGIFGAAKDKSVFQPRGSCVSVAESCVAHGCSVDLFLFSQEPVGVASLGHASDISGGGVYMYSSLQEEADREQFQMDLRRNFQREIGFDAVMKIHVSKGLTVSGCFGPLSVGTGGPSELALGAIDSDKAFAVEFTHQGQLDPERGVVIQCALSYTAPSGQRRTRVHTLSLNCSCHLVDTFRNSQAETLLAFYCKKVYSAVLHSSPLSLRDSLLSELTRTLASYRQHGSTSAVSAGQLVLPQFLKVLPVYLNCLRKSEVLLPGPHSALSDRVYQRSLAVAMDTAETAAHFYPRLLPLPVSGQFWSAVRCSQRSLAPDRVFLAEDGRGLFLWVGGCVPPQLVQSLFNVPSSRDLRCGACSLPVLDTPLSRSVRGAILTLREHRSRHMKVCEMSKRKRQQSAGGKRKRTTKKKKETQEKALGTVNEESAACGQQAELHCEDDPTAPSSTEERGVTGSRSESEGGDGAHKLSPGVKDCFLPLTQNILPGRSSTAGSSCDDDEDDDDDDVAQPSAPEDTTSDQHKGAGEEPGQGDTTLHSHGGAHGPNHKASTSGEQRQEADPERQQPTVTEQGGAGEGGQEHLPHSEGCGTPGLKTSVGLEGTETQGGGVAGSPQGGLACLLGSAEAVFTEGGKQSESAKPTHVETSPETQAETSADLQGKGVAEPCNEAGAQPAPPHSHCRTPGEPPTLPAAGASTPEREESTRLCKGVIPRQGRGVATEKGSQVFPNPGSGTTPPPRASAASWSPRSCAGRSRIRLRNGDAESAAGRQIPGREEAGPEMNEKDLMRETLQSHSQRGTETEEAKASQSCGEGEGSDWGQKKLSENNKLSTSSSSAAAAAAAESKPAAVYVNPCVLEERDWESRFAVLEMEDSNDAGAGQRKAKGAVRSRRCKPATSAAAAAAAGKREVTTALVCAETACPDLTHTEAEGSLQGAAGAGGQTNPASAAQDREEEGPHPCTPAAARGSPESEREDAGDTQSCEDHSEWDSEFLHDCSTQRFPDSCSLPAPLSVLGTESGGSALELPLSIGSISDSQLHEITLGEAMLEPRSQSLQDYEDASELVCGLIEELSQINRLIMLTHRELQSGRNPRRARLGWRGAARYTANPKDL